MPSRIGGCRGRRFRKAGFKVSRFQSFQGLDTWQDFSLRPPGYPRFISHSDSFLTMIKELYAVPPFCFTAKSFFETLIPFSTITPDTYFVAEHDTARDDNTVNDKQAVQLFFIKSLLSIL